MPWIFCETEFKTRVCEGWGDSYIMYHSCLLPAEIYSLNTLIRCSSPTPPLSNLTLFEQAGLIPLSPSPLILSPPPLALRRYFYPSPLTLLQPTSTVVRFHPIANSFDWFQNDIEFQISFRCRKRRSSSSLSRHDSYQAKNPSPGAHILCKLLFSWNCDHHREKHKNMSTRCEASGLSTSTIRILPSYLFLWFLWKPTMDWPAEKECCSWRTYSWNDAN